MENGHHTIDVKATASGQKTSFQSSFTVAPAIDTHITGAPVREYALFVLESSGPERKHYEYKIDDDDWIVHRSDVLQIGPLSFGDHTLQVRAVDIEDQPDPIPATFMWTIADSPPARIVIPPIDSASPFTHVEVNASKGPIRYSIDGEVFHGKPKVLGPLKAGVHTLQVWAGDDNAPALASWRQSKAPSFGSAEIQVGVDEEGEHTLYAKATDPLGVVDKVGASFTFVADFTPPSATLKKLPSVQYNNVTELHVECTDKNGCSKTMIVKIDDKPEFRAEREGFKTEELEAGRHTIQIWALDKAGNRQANPVTGTILIDRTPPPPPRIKVPLKWSRLPSLKLMRSTMVHGICSEKSKPHAVKQRGLRLCQEPLAQKQS